MTLKTGAVMLKIQLYITRINYILKYIMCVYVHLQHRLHSVESMRMLNVNMDYVLGLSEDGTSGRRTEELRLNP